MRLGDLGIQPNHEPEHFPAVCRCRYFSDNGNWYIETNAECPLHMCPRDPEQEAQYENLVGTTLYLEDHDEGDED